MVLREEHPHAGQLGIARLLDVSARSTCYDTLKHANYFRFACPSLKRAIHWGQCFAGC